jgi:hypothetical protein
MKEIAFAQRVLGHESVNVSLLYTSIRIDTGVDDVGGYNEHMERQMVTMQNELKDMRDAIGRLEAHNVTPEVRFKSESGESVSIPKIGRAKRKEMETNKETYHKKRAIEVITKLVDNGVKVSTTNIRLLGGTNDSRVIDSAVIEMGL